MLKTVSAHARFGSQTERRRSDTLAMIAILEKKRAEVMDKQDAGYFIHDWHELRDQVVDAYE
jgi:hypothetical protein